MRTTIFTNCGKLGDSLFCLPVISDYKKRTGHRTIFALSSLFLYSLELKELLEMQWCIDELVYFHHDELKCELRSKENLIKYHIPRDMLPSPYNEYNFDMYDLGFHKWPDKYISELYAEEYGFNVDYDFVLNYGDIDYTYKDVKVKVDKYEDLQLESFTDYYLLESSNSIVKNIQYAAGAKEVLTFSTGFSVLATLARIPITIYAPQHLIDHHKNYFDIHGGITWIHY